MMFCTLEDDYYLLGTYFVRKVVNGTPTFDKWYETPDLTSVTELTEKIRPIPYTPVMVNALTGGKPKLWGTNKQGKLMSLGLGLPFTNSDGKAIDGELVENDASNGQSDSLEHVLLHHSARVERLCDGVDYELSIPPLNLLAQLISLPNEDGGPSDINDLATNLKNFATTVDPDQIGVSFKLTKILPSQLAPAYPGENLTEEQEAYNEWRKERIAKPNKPIKGFMLPQLHTCAVLFTDPLYAGAEVSLIRPVKDVKAGSLEDAAEQVIQTVVVQKPKHTLKSDKQEHFGIPSAIFHFDPTMIDDGFYLIRVEFWQADWEKYHEEQGDGLKFPESVKQANVKKALIAKTEGDRPQNHYTYDLHEKLTFLSSPGIGKIACVCGDMLSLEEAIIQQFPTYLPEFSDYVTNGLTSKEFQSRPGLGALSLAATINKTYENLRDDFISIDGLKLKSSAGDIAKTIALSLWENTDNKQLPDIIMSGVALNAAFSAAKDAVAKYDAAKIRSSHTLGVKKTLHLILKKGIADTSYIKRLNTSFDKHTIERSIGRLSESWASGNVVKAFNRALPIVTSATSMYEAYETYEGYKHALDNADDVYKNLQELSTNYLEKLTFIKKYDDKQHWQDKAEAVKSGLGEDAKIVADKQGISLRLNFQFNSALLENEMRNLHNNFDQICKNLCKLLENNPDYQIVIEGHAGLIGSEQNNLKLSKRRADFIRENILGNANDKESLGPRLVIKAYGKSRLTRGSEDNYQDKTDTSDSAEIAVDRRVEVRLVIPDFKVTLPPSRSGILKLESLHQLWQGYMLAVDDEQEKLVSSAIDAMASIALLTPAAPLAAMYLIGDASFTLLSTAADFCDDLSGTDTFAQIKERFKNKHDLYTLSKLNQKLLARYRDINTKIEVTVVSNENLSAHLKSQAKAEELLKRFLLRAYAVNSLIELLCILASKEGWFNDSDKLLKNYHVDLFIQKYVMNDDWEIPVYMSNTLAQNWVNRFNHHTHTYLGLDQNVFFGPSVSGAFNSGFPVQTSLYLDKAKEGLKQFYQDFNLAKQGIEKEDIGFQRLLIQKPNHGVNQGKWITYKDWLEEQKNVTDISRGKIGPQTRLKLQIIFTKDATEKSKSAFVQQIQYRSVVTGFDVKGPEFDVLFTKKDKSNFIDPDDQIKDYFDTTGEQELIGVEFEPTFYFGDKEFYGVKPLSAMSLWDEVEKNVNYRKLSDFEYLLKQNRFSSLQYAFSLAGIDIGLAIYHHTTNDGVESSYQHHLYYGIQGVDSESETFDTQQCTISSYNDRDFLVEDFVMSTSANRSDNTPAVLKDNVFSVSAVQIGSEFKFIKDWSFSELGKHFSWEKEQEFSVYIALLGDNISWDDYKKMQLDTHKVPMTLKLSDSQENAGPILQSDMHYTGELKISSTPHYSMEVADDNEGKITVSYNFDIEASKSIEIEPKHKELVDFNKKVIEHLEASGEEYTKQLKDAETKHMYVMKFDCQYIAPNGKEIKGLRPYSKMIDDDKFYAKNFRLGTLTQTGLNISYKVSVKDLYLRALDKSVEGMPWASDIAQDKAADVSAWKYWKQLSAKEKQEWVADWIEKNPTSLQAPSITLKQI